MIEGGGALTKTQPIIVNKWLIVITIMLLAILEVLDSTIVNVSLPAMMASLGANQNQITWVLTSYVVAAAIVLPLTGFLTNFFGQKKFLLICATGFMLSSFFCGVSQSLSQIVFFRVLQGAFGASLIPISQAILRHTFPKEELGKAMAIWGLGIMVAPVFGPTLGGFITSHASWRWVFYINLPVCLLGIVLIFWVIKETQRIKDQLDYLGLFLMVIGVGCLQVFLDKGNEHDWFSSNLILILALTSVVALIGFIYCSLVHSKPFVNLRIYRDRNFRICSLLMLIFCGNAFGFITLAPIMMQHLFGYSAVLSGWVIAPLGVSSAVAMMITPIFLKRFNVKIILTVSLILASIGTARYSLLTTDVTVHYFMLNNCFIGLGMGSFMVPLTTYALLTVPRRDFVGGSGLFSYARMLGTSIGISLLSTLLTRYGQINWNRFVGYVNTFNHNLMVWLHYQHLSSLNGLAVSRLSYQFSHQMTALAFIYAYRVITLVFLLAIPIAFLLKSVSLTDNQNGDLR